MPAEFLRETGTLHSTAADATSSGGSGGSGGFHGAETLALHASAAAEAPSPPGTRRPPEDPPERTPLTGWFAVLAVALGIFSLMTSELLPVGLLTPIGSDLHVSEGVAGLMVTVPGLVAAVSAPLVTIATGRYDRRLVLVLLVGVVGLANLAAAFASHFAFVLAARFLIGVSVGGFWSIAGSIALRLVAPQDVARATALVFAGVETASVLGVPTGTLLGDLGGWRVAFAAVGALGLAALTAMAFLLPPLPAERTLTLAELPRTFRANAGLRTGLAMAFLAITGHFVAYTFVRPVLSDDGIGDGLIGVLLLVFGAAGIAGNFLAGALVGRSPRGAVVGIGLTLAIAMTLLAVVGSAGTWASAALSAVWGLGYGAVPVTFQTWIMRAAPYAPEPASSLYVSVFNVSIALGALAGGVVVNGLSTTAVLAVGAALAAATALLAVRRPTD